MCYTRGYGLNAKPTEETNGVKLDVSVSKYI